MAGVPRHCPTTTTATTPVGRPDLDEALVEKEVAPVIRCALVVGAFDFPPPCTPEGATGGSECAAASAANLDQSRG